MIHGATVGAWLAAGARSAITLFAFVGIVELQGDTERWFGTVGSPAHARANVLKLVRLDDNCA